MLLFTLCAVLVVLNLPKILTFIKLVVYGIVRAVAALLMYGVVPALFVLSVMLKTKGIL